MNSPWSTDALNTITSIGISPKPASLGILNDIVVSILSLLSIVILVLFPKTVLLGVLPA